MKLGDFFKSNKGRWVLTGLLIVLLMTIATYPQYWSHYSDTQAGMEDILASYEEDPTMSDQEVATANYSEENQISPTLAPENQTTDGDNPALLDELPSQLTEEPAITINAGPISWIFPLDGEIGRSHGFSFDSTYEDYRFHHGIDIMSQPGTPVFAVGEGQVIIAREDSFWGGIITIDHNNGWQSIYRCITPKASYGDKVISGEIIGYTLESAKAEAGQEAHLHFEMYLDDDEVDPLQWL